MTLIATIITFPITWVLLKIENNPSMYRFRIDMILQGITGGFLVVYVIDYLLLYFETEVNFWWLVLTMMSLSSLKIYGWDRSKPNSYEFSLNIPPIIGYIIGLSYIYIN